MILNKKKIKMATLIKPGKAGEVKKGQRTTVKIVKTNPIKKKK